MKIEHSGYSALTYGLLFITVLLMIQLRQGRITNFNCEICADKAGYYMYLPAIFQLGFTADNYPDGFDSDHGGGFKIDRENNRVVTKFTCGVAVLLLPFYGLAFLISTAFGINADPYSYFYLFFTNIGAACYLIIGLFFFEKWLRFSLDPISSRIASVLTFFGTNLFYYTLDESLMSHLYGFSLFAILLYAMRSFLQTRKFNRFILFSTALSLAILIRPTNIIFGVVALLIDVQGFSDIKKRCQLLFQPRYLFWGLAILFVTLLPQMMYWKFAFDRYIVWSYEGEGFKFWDAPEFMLVWFSPQSGLFTYTPIILLSLFFTAFQIKQRKSNAVVVIGTFLLVSYMCAAWHNPYFGTCNFGKRPMVEYLPILMLPIAYLISKILSWNNLVMKYAIAMAIWICVAYNLTLFSAFDTCFFGDKWDWVGFEALLKRAFYLQ